MRKTLLFVAAALLSCVLSAQQWAPAGDKIKTVWAEKVNPSNPLPEYPRPQMVRAQWQSLNGLWDYAITPADAESFSAEGKILVPFVPESALSGVGRQVGDKNALWYERTFTIDKKWKNKNIILNFGAVDWKAEVWVNDAKVAEHTGGFTPFSVDITKNLKKKGAQTLRLKVWDPTDNSYHPRGKQVCDPHGIWYTPVTGIWQSVWIEAVAPTHIESYYAVSDIDAGKISVSVQAAGLQEGDAFKAELLEGGVGYSAEKPSTELLCSAQAQGELVLEVKDAKLWSPDSPYLYGLKISIIRAGKVVDSVDGYTAMRKVSKVRTPDNFLRLGLNNEPVFHYGPLDQGWWPDGLYTAPTDEALRFDIEKTKAFGFNMIRKHIKVEPARWYYWCDVEGIMVWQDMPSIGDHGMGSRPSIDRKIAQDMANVWSSDSHLDWRGGFLGTDVTVPQEAKDNYYKEWGEIISAVKCFPSIVVWVPFNEAWGQFDTPAAVEFTRALDPTRLINESSGGNWAFCSDILDVHHYPYPVMNVFEGKMVNVIGEYGGIGYPIEGHLWKEAGGNWGYGRVKASGAEVLDQYAIYAERLKENIRTGCSAAVYTQTTDVEIEVNGLMTYDRKIIKMNEAQLAKINKAVIDYQKEVVEQSRPASSSFPKIDQGGKVAIVAHRGFWKCEEAGYAQNSIASLRCAQQAGCWGSECDVRFTADDVIVVNHDETIAGRDILSSTYAELSDARLKNGEKLATLDEYLDQAAKCETTILVIEIKPLPVAEKNEQLTRKVLETVKAHGLYDPSRVLFISFCKPDCELLAKEAPEFVNQYLNGDFSPEGVALKGINGIDYEDRVLLRNRDWAQRAHQLGMSVNVWTVDSKEGMNAFIEMGVDAITTNEPLVLRGLLGEKELK